MPAPALRLSLLSVLPRWAPAKLASCSTAPSRRWNSDVPSSRAPPSDNLSSSNPPSGLPPANVAVSSAAPSNPPSSDASSPENPQQDASRPNVFTQREPDGTGAMSDLFGILRRSPLRANPRKPKPSPLASHESASAMVAVNTTPNLSSYFDAFALTSTTPHEDDHHLHIYSTKHNTHISFTKPNKDCIVSKSTGNLGFKKAQRGSYDAAYQLAAFVFKALEQKGVRPRSIEVLMRGFGQGREAVIKALLGQEGKFLRPVLKRVTDSTRLKFGGTRSPKPRRLG